MRKKLFAILAMGMLTWLAGIAEAAQMGTAWTYQGRLMGDNDPADGLYDFQFKLFDDLNVADGNQVGSDVNVPDVDVIDGYFTVELDFGAAVFDGNARWLEIGVRPGDSNDPNAYVILNPLQEVTPIPYALQTRGFFVDDSNKVGIGTRSPAGKLHVSTPATYGDIIFFDEGGGLNDLSVDPDSVYTGNIDRIYVVEVTDEEDDVDRFKWSDDGGVTWSAELDTTTSWYDLSHGVRIKWDETEGHFDRDRLIGDKWTWIAYHDEENSLVVTGGNVGIGTTPNDRLTIKGALSLEGIPPPSETSGYGKIYVKYPDGGLYFKNEAGTEYKLSAVDENFIAGDYLLNANDTFREGVSENPSLLKETKIGRGGSLRIKFDFKGEAGMFVYAQIRRNNTAVGTLRSTNSATYVTYTEDISGWSKGDLVQLWGYTTGGLLHPIGVRNLRLYVDNPPEAGARL